MSDEAKKTRTSRGIPIFDDGRPASWFRVEQREDEDWHRVQPIAASEWFRLADVPNPREWVSRQWPPGAYRIVWAPEGRKPEQEGRSFKVLRVPGPSPSSPHVPPAAPAPSGPFVDPVEQVMTVYKTLRSDTQSDLSQLTGVMMGGFQLMAAQTQKASEQNTANMAAFFQSMMTGQKELATRERTIMNDALARTQAVAEAATARAAQAPPELVELVTKFTELEEDLDERFAEEDEPDDEEEEDEGDAAKFGELGARLGKSLSKNAVEWVEKNVMGKDDDDDDDDDDDEQPEDKSAGGDLDELDELEREIEGDDDEEGGDDES